jgi:hypothetical protein
MVSVWNPEPPPWFAACSDSAESLKAPQPSLQPPKFVTDLPRYTDSSTGPEFDPVSARQELSGIENLALDTLIKLLKGTEEGGIGAGILDNLDKRVTRVHCLLSQWREHQAHELIIQQLEEAVDDHQNAIDSIESASKVAQNSLLQDRP